MHHKGKLTEHSGEVMCKIFGYIEKQSGLSWDRLAVCFIGGDNWSTLAFQR